MTGKLYLLENHKLNFQYFTRSLNEVYGEIELKPEDIFPLDRSEISWMLSNDLRDFLRSKVHSRNVRLTLKKDDSNDLARVNRFKLCIEGQFFEKLFPWLGNEVVLNVKLDRLKYINLRWSTDHRARPLNVPAVVSSGLKPTLVKEETGNIFIFEDVHPRNNWPFGEDYSPGMMHQAEVTITLASSNPEISWKEFCKSQDLRPSSSDLVEFTKRILQEQISPDTTIIAGNGVEIGCHKIFLLGNSPVFEAMLDKENFQEGKFSRIKMEDMSEIGVMALLAYLYYLDVASAVKDFDIAMELLEASEKYAINRLKQAIKKIFLAKRADWFQDNKALQLFLFARNAEDCGDLKKKAVEMLQAKHEELEKCFEYKDLFEKNPEAAMDLCNELFRAIKMTA